MHDWAATTFGWGSVMDYLAANVQEKDGQLDFSDAYPGDIGSYDRLMIRWGYSADGNPARLDAIVREGYARGIVYPLESDPRWAEYDWGADPVQWLATTQQVRRVILDRFGAHARPASGSTICRSDFRCLPLPSVRHPGATEAFHQRPRGRGQKPVAWVAPARQRGSDPAALEALGRKTSTSPTASSRGPSPPQGETDARAPSAGRFLAHDRGPGSGPDRRLFAPERGAATLDDDGRAGSTSCSTLVAGTGISGAPQAVLPWEATQRVVLDDVDLAANDGASPEVRGSRWS
jgi:hypothetical protein